MNKIVKWTLVAFGIFILIAIVWFVSLISAFGVFDKVYSPDDLKASFQEKKTEIYELKHYFNKIVPKNRFVEIEFSSDHELARFGIKALDSTAGDITEPMFLEWDLSTETEKMDSLIKPMGWSRATLAELKEKLDNAGCIQIESGEPTKIGFKRSGMGFYFFNVFDNPMPDSLKSNYDEMCTHIYVDPKLVLEYGGGAVGPQCFAEKIQSTNK
ncbi:hypothetical protein [Pedobacter nyackensis]|uniref:Uncharacterized protein n=1 Tax=Pedobacter nyackensis TaxID=475255 RepID=A0A1W2AKR3_9SPHI|nr:hypothetical protein [Pedobacter nyackensis]SMC60838.1 hypothetical protein SAMN04488101_101671 [Pedobacter nyackensis]